MKNKIFLFIFLLSIFFSNNLFSNQKKQYDFTNSTDAITQIIQEIKNKKIIFIGDSHDQATPVLFLAENLEKFYNAGIRYLFLEENSDNFIENPDNFELFVYPPWCSWGYNYEYLIMEKEIIKINIKYPNDQLIVVWPETGLHATKEDFYKEGNHYMNLRDSYAQKNIIKIMDNTNKKALIFYGASHGLKVPFNFSNIDYDVGEDWKMIGSYLNDHYGKDYSSFLIINFSTNETKNVKYNTNKDIKVLSKDVLTEVLKIDGIEKPEYDYYCTYPEYKASVPSYYFAEDYILNCLKKLTYLKDFSEDENKIDVWSKKSEKILAKYYLAYHKKIKDKKINLTLEEMELYREFLMSYNCIVDYLFGYNNSDLSLINYILDNLNKAKKINNIDIWPQYWISYFLTEKANISGNKKDYKKALKAWEELLQNDLIYESPVLKLIYKKISLCEKKLGNVNKSQIYQQKMNIVKDEIPINYEDFVYYGY